VRQAPSEVVIFAGMAAFGLIAGASYGVLTGDVVGTCLLGAFGIAAAVAAISVRRGLGAGSKGTAERAGTDAGSTAETDLTAELPTEPEPEQFPAPGWAPFGVAVGLGMVGFGLSLGPWLLIVGALLAIAAGWTWLNRAMAEDDEARLDEGHVVRSNEGPGADPR